MIKKCILSLLMIVLIKLAGAQVMAQKKEWITIKSPNLKCWQCKALLEKYLISENESTMQSGIVQRKYNLIVGEIRIQYYPDRVTPDEIRTVINNAGFDTEDAKAEPEPYKKLPPICKRAEDGGGQQKGAPPCHIEPYQP